MTFLCFFIISVFMGVKAGGNATTSCVCVGAGVGVHSATIATDALLELHSITSPPRRINTVQLDVKLHWIWNTVENNKVTKDL